MSQLHHQTHKLWTWISITVILYVHFDQAYKKQIRREQNLKLVSQEERPESISVQRSPIKRGLVQLQMNGVVREDVCKLTFLVSFFPYVCSNPLWIMSKYKLFVIFNFYHSCHRIHAQVGINTQVWLPVPEAAFTATYEHWGPEQVYKPLK